MNAGVTAYPSDARPPVVRHLLLTLIRGRWVILSCLAVTLAAAGVWLTLADPIYEAHSTVIVDTDRRSVDIVGLGAYRDVLVEVEVLRSLDLARRVADRLLSMREDRVNPVAAIPLFAGGDGLPVDGPSIARALKERVEVEQVRREVGVVRIALRSTLPEEARLVADLYADEYVRRNLESSRSEASTLRTFLEEQMDDRRAALVDAEQRIQSFQEAERAVILDREADQLASRMAELQSLEDQSQVELRMVEAELASLEREAARIEPNLYGRVASGLETEIAALQERIAEWEVRVETKYARNPGLRGNEEIDPELAGDVRTLAGLRREVEARSRDYVDEVMATGGIDPVVASRLGQGSSVPGALSNISRLRSGITDKTIEASGLRARLSVLRGRLASLQGEFERIPRQTRELAGLERVRRSTESTVDWLQRQVEEARVAEQSEFGYVRVLDRALTPSKPVAPRRAYTLALATMLGLLAGLLLVLGGDTLDDRVRLPVHARRFGYPVAGVLPISDRPGPRLRAAAARIAGTLDIGGGARTVLVTSCRARDGRTTVAAALAEASAFGEHRTLLLDLDPIHPSVHAASGTPMVPGLTNVLYQGTLVREAVHPTAVHGLFVLPIGDIAVGPSWYPPVQELGALLAYLGRSFDRVVADAAPLLESGRVAAVAPLFDRVLLVSRAGRTRGSDIEEARSLLELGRNRDVQFVLNGVDAGRSFAASDRRSANLDRPPLQPVVPVQRRSSSFEPEPPIPPFPGPGVEAGSSPTRAAVFDPTGTLPGPA